MTHSGRSGLIPAWAIPAPKPRCGPSYRNRPGPPTLRCGLVPARRQIRLLRRSHSPDTATEVPIHVSHRDRPQRSPRARHPPESAASEHRGGSAGAKPRPDPTDLTAARQPISRPLSPHQAMPDKPTLPWPNHRRLSVHYAVPWLPDLVVARPRLCRSSFPRSTRGLRSGSQRAADLGAGWLCRLVAPSATSKMALPSLHTNHPMASRSILSGFVTSLIDCSLIQASLVRS
jgi:hypothetical protein